MGPLIRNLINPCFSLTPNYLWRKVRCLVSIITTVYLRLDAKRSSDATLLVRDRMFVCPHARQGIYAWVPVISLEQFCGLFFSSTVLRLPLSYKWGKRCEGDRGARKDISNVHHVHISQILRLDDFLGETIRPLSCSSPQQENEMRPEMLIIDPN